MTHPYEDPKKTELRERCEQALDAAGFDVLPSLQSIPFPVGFDLKGFILGDIQCTDSQNERHVYAVRPTTEGPIPQWLVNWARASHLIPDVLVYVIVEEATEDVESSCRAAGAGLLLLHEDNRLEEILDPRELDPDERRKGFERKVTRARRELQKKIDLHQSVVEEDFTLVNRITSSMPDETRAGYIRATISYGMKVDEWADEISVEIDRTLVTQSDDDLAGIMRRIDAGPK